MAPAANHDVLAHWANTSLSQIAIALDTRLTFKIILSQNRRASAAWYLHPTAMSFHPGL